MAKKGWGGRRPRTGGKRKNAGRKHKFYPPIRIFYKPSESKENLLKALDDLYIWVLGDKIDTRRAATGAHVLETTAKIKIPSLIEEKINDLERQAERLRKTLADRVAAEADRARNTETKSTASTGSGTVDSKDKDPQR